MHRYPTRNGIALPSKEIWTPESHLKDIEKNKNNHHDEWTARAFGCSILYLTLRNMESHQEMMQKDVHDWIHDEYDVPEMPTPRQAMEEIERGYWEQENLKVRKAGHYVLSLLDKGVLNLCKNDYNNYK